MKYVVLWEQPCLGVFSLVFYFLFLFNFFIVFVIIVILFLD